jgi:hypothetical protein
MNKYVTDWKTFWRNYRRANNVSTPSLFYEVGKTVNGRSISSEVFERLIDDIVVSLNLMPDDSLLEMCCGNGLITKPLSPFVNKIYAFDFTEHLIQAAVMQNYSANIQYAVGDANGKFLNYFKFDRSPNKILMNDSLAYFTPYELKGLLRYISKEINVFTMYITGIPNKDLQNNFYDTPERRARYEHCVQQGDLTNDGLGYWWNLSDIAQIAYDLGLNAHMTNQPEYMSNFRSNVVISSEQ